MTTITNDTNTLLHYNEPLDGYPLDDEPFKETQPNGGQSLTAALRIFGACAVIASLSLFLIEGWTDGNDLSRYMKLLAQTGLITGAGLFLSFVVKEVKGARVFFGLGLISAVANFTILGALAYSIYQIDGALGLGEYHSMLKWQAIDLSQFLPLAIGAIAMLSLLALFSFSIFARRSAKTLTCGFLAANALLLVPAREAVFVAVLAAIALFIAIRITLNVIRSKEILLTAEAKFALACLYVPGLIIITRALGLYAVDELVLLTLFSLLYYGLRSVSAMATSETKLQKLMTISQYIAGVAIAILLATLLPSPIGGLGAAVFSAVIIAITLDQTNLKARLATKTLASGFNGDLAQALIFATCFGVVTVNVGDAAITNSLLVKISNLISISALLVMLNQCGKTFSKPRAGQLMAMTGFIATLIMVILKTIAMLNVGSWVLIGSLGIGLILLASLYERFGIRFKLPPSNSGA